MKKDQINKDTPIYTISIVSNLLNVSVHTLRMYEREGLIITYKKTSGHRLYSQNDVEKISCIRNAIKEKKVSISAIRMMYSLLPCWKILGCSEEERKQCKAYNNYDNPCWTVIHYNNICANKDCRECPVYAKQASCNSIKDVIKDLTK
jgi:MerR family transcriptional regulator/heat shock protein HspR